MPDSFHRRFSIEVGEEEAQRRFVKRALNEVLTPLVLSTSPLIPFFRAAATQLGENVDDFVVWEKLIGGEFHRCLQALEVVYALSDESLQREIEQRVLLLLKLSETGLGVRWKAGIFYPAGAQELDEALVNRNLDWLREVGMDQVLGPFEKGLLHLLSAHSQPALLQDVVTDRYESLEALAKAVTGRGRDLSANREQFLSRLGATPLGSILKEYIDYGCRFRHGQSPQAPRTTPVEPEVEAFVYLTGVFIRLAQQRRELWA